MLILGIGAVVAISTNNTFAQQNQNSANPSITIEDNETSVAGPSPSPEVIPQLDNETGAGFSNVTDLAGLTNENQPFLQGDRPVSAPVGTLEGMEKSQLGNAIPGNQNTILEGEVMQNVSQINSTGNSS